MQHVNSTEMNVNRRRIMQAGASAAVGALTLASATAQAGQNPARQPASASAKPKEARYWLTNVTLEDGFERGAENQVLSTKTRQAHLLIENGKIMSIAESRPADGLPQYDMKQSLALPSFADMHIHLDKGHYGGPWKAAVPFVSVAQRIKEEEGFLVPFLADTPKKAKALINLSTSFGTTHMRVQCNVDPVQGLRNKDKVLEALTAYRDKIDYDMVAFPQHGLLKHVKLMDEAMRNGFNIVGGLDPTSIDGDVERSLNTTMELAVKHNAPIDMHLHEPGAQGAAVISRLAKLTEDAGWQGRVTVSHAYCLGQLKGNPILDEVLSRMAAVKMQVISTAPIDTPAPPVKELASKGIMLHLATDCINDHWSAYGSGSMIERASRLGEINGWDDEFSLNRALKYITRGVAPLDDQGKVVWPKVGDNADLTFVAASCSAELVARRNPVDAVLRRGKASVWNI